MTSADEERSCDPPAPILTRYVNLCDKYTLTIEEAAVYFGIGQKKIRSLVQTHENDDFILHVGVKVLIKRKKFENFIDRSLFSLVENSAEVWYGGVDRIAI